MAWQILKHINAEACQAHKHSNKVSTQACKAHDLADFTKIVI